MNKASKLLLLILASTTIAGCNELLFTNLTTTAGLTVTMPITLQLDEGVSIGGIQTIITVDPPLVIGTCAFTEAADPISDRSPTDNQSVKLVALPISVEFGWTGTNIIANCPINIPLSTIPGTYYTRFQSVSISNPQGVQMGGLIYNKKGVIDVFP